jgi:hypothetical protein
MGQCSSSSVSSSQECGKREKSCSPALKQENSQQTMGREASDQKARLVPPTTLLTLLASP